MLIAHLTDLHIVPEGERLGKVLDVNALADTAVDTINAEPHTPAFAVVTGDLTHTGSRVEMENARRILDRLDMPYFAIPGGHDESDIFSETFADRGWRDPAGDFRYSVDDYPVRLVAADTTTGKSGKPQFGAERCAWLESELSKAPDRPTLLAIHHPPFQCRIPVATYVEDYHVAWAEGLKAVVSRHPQVQTLICGHVHRTTHVRWAGTIASIGPSTSVQTDPLFTDYTETGIRGRLAAEPGGWQALWWDGEALLNFGLLADRSYARF